MSYKIFGLQRAGTTYLNALIELNLPIKNGNENTWKHVMNLPKPDGVPSIAIIKNPYTWLESVVYREPADLEVTYPYLVEEDEEMGMINGFNLTYLGAHWSKWAESFHRKPNVMIRYEDLLKNPRDWLKLVSSVTKTDLPEKIKLPEPGSLFMSEGYTNEMVPYYLDMKPKYVTTKHLKHFNALLTDTALKFYNYDRVETSDGMASEE